MALEQDAKWKRKSARAKISSNFELTRSLFFYTDQYNKGSCRRWKKSHKKLFPLYCVTLYHEVIESSQAIHMYWRSMHACMHVKNSYREVRKSYHEVRSLNHEIISLNHEIMSLSHEIMSLNQVKRFTCIGAATG